MTPQYGHDPYYAVRRLPQACIMGAEGISHASGRSHQHVTVAAEEICGAYDHEPLESHGYDLGISIGYMDMSWGEEAGQESQGAVLLW